MMLDKYVSDFLQPFVFDTLDFLLILVKEPFFERVDSDVINETTYNKDAENC